MSALTLWRCLVFGDVVMWICIEGGLHGDDDRAYRLFDFPQDDPTGPLAQLDTWAQVDYRYRRLGRGLDNPGAGGDAAG